MSFKITKKNILVSLFTGVLIVGCLVFYAFYKTWDKTDIEFSIHINEKLIKESTFGESPTFAIWLEDPETKLTKTIFVTSRAGLGDWEGKAAVPVALPLWFQINEKEKQSKQELENKIPAKVTITGATPKPGYFSTRVNVAPGSKWICWIEVNLAGDFNDTYKEYDAVNKTSDEYKTGQPALLYRTEIEATIGKEAKPIVQGMCFLDDTQGVRIEPLEGITTATDIFDQIKVKIVKPRPRILD